MYEITLRAISLSNVEGLYVYFLVKHTRLKYNVNSFQAEIPIMDVSNICIRITLINLLFIASNFFIVLQCIFNNVHNLICFVQTTKLPSSKENTSLT